MTPAKRPREHHLRVTYALADLYERAGDVPRARQLFGIVAPNDPELGDVENRIRAMRRGGVRVRSADRGRRGCGAGGARQTGRGAWRVRGSAYGRVGGGAQPK